MLLCRFVSCEINDPRLDVVFGPVGL
jgi:hypothetical protein